MQIQSVGPMLYILQIKWNSEMEAFWQMVPILFIILKKKDKTKPVFVSSDVFHSCQNKSLIINDIKIILHRF